MKHEAITLKEVSMTNDIIVDTRDGEYIIQVHYRGDNRNDAVGVLEELHRVCVRTLERKYGTPQYHQANGKSQALNVKPSIEEKVQADVPVTPTFELLDTPVGGEVSAKAAKVHTAHAIGGEVQGKPVEVTPTVAPTLEPAVEPVLEAPVVETPHAEQALSFELPDDWADEVQAEAKALHEQAQAIQAKTASTSVKTNVTSTDPAKVMEELMAALHSEEIQALKADQHKQVKEPEYTPTGIDFLKLIIGKSMRQRGLDTENEEIIIPKLKALNVVIRHLNENGKEDMYVGRLVSDTLNEFHATGVDWYLEDALKNLKMFERSPEDKVTLVDRGDQQVYGMFTMKDLGV